MYSSFTKAHKNFFLLFSLFLIPLIPSSSWAISFSSFGIRINKDIKPLRDIRRTNIVTQSLDFSCGAAGLSTLLNYYLNDPVSEGEIINSLLQVVPLAKIKERRGFSLFDLKTYAKQKGYNVTGYKMDIDFLRHLHKPVLVPIKFRNYRHFVIVKAVMADRVFIADPAVGNVSMKINKFQDLWLDGIGLLVEKPHEDKNSDYALKIAEKDFVSVDYKLMRSIMTPDVISTTIHTGEF